jgi:hypothetical protein
MRTIILCSNLLSLAVTAVAASPRKIALERGNDIWVADADGTKAKAIAAGSLSDISPGGYGLL